MNAAQITDPTIVNKHVCTEEELLHPSSEQ
jgi:hypothetical protein